MAAGSGLETERERAMERVFEIYIRTTPERFGANGELYGGWPMILSGLKTWLESGELLTTPDSPRYGGADSS